MTLNAHYQAVEVFPFESKSTLNKELSENLEWIYLHR